MCTSWAKGEKVQLWVLRQEFFRARFTYKAPLSAYRSKGLQMQHVQSDLLQGMGVEEARKELSPVCIGNDKLLHHQKRARYLNCFTDIFARNVAKRQLG